MGGLKKSASTDNPPHAGMSLTSRDFKPVYAGDAVPETELRPPGVVLTTVQKLLNWSRKNSLWKLMMPMGCCGIEWIVTSLSHYDTDRFGILPRDTPRQSDVLIISGYVSKKYLPRIKKLYDQMPEPKWVLAIGECAYSGGPFYQSYNIVQDVNEHIPIDVMVPGCPPRPEAFLDGFIKLQKLMGTEGWEKWRR